MSSLDVDQLAKAVGKAISRQRQACQLTQEEVAKRLRIGNEVVSRIECGIVLPSIARLLELANIFQCAPADLLTEGSNRAVDQALYTDRLLVKLGSQDRELVVEVVEKLVSRLTKG